MQPTTEITEVHRARRLLCALLPCLAWADAAMGLDYEVSSQVAFTALNAADFAPGDRILLAGGMSFSGKLVLGPEDSGTDEQGNLIAPVVITSSGSGRATINAGDQGAIVAYNCGGIEISRLSLQGSGVTAEGTSTNSGSGITVYADLPGDLKFQHIRIDEVEVSGFGDRGVVVGGYNGNTGYRDVLISGVNAHHNRHCGIETFAYPGSTQALVDVVVRNCIASDQTGDPESSGNTGSGIALGGVSGGLIERCTAHHNGALNPHDEGPVGIWAYSSTGVVIQHNVSYSNSTSNGDGGGFDLDIQTSNSVLQYNYSHHNAGAGYLAYGKTGANLNSGNIIRYNVSENDGRDPGSYSASGICVAGNVDDLAVFGNTVFFAAVSGTTTIPAIKVLDTGSDPDDCIVSNNIFHTTGGARLVECDTDGSIVFAGNNYWSGGTNFVIRDDGSNYSSLSSWRSAKNQEKLSGSSTGLSQNPRFQGTPGSVPSADDEPAERLKALRLKADSPLIDRGLDVKARFTLEPGPQDFFGGFLKQGSGHEIGAHEWALAAPVITALSVQPDASAVTLRYRSEIGLSFRVRRSANLAGDPATTWEDLGTTALGTGEEMSFTDQPPAGGRHFYVLVRE
jgi:hypothetical protein